MSGPADPILSDCQETTVANGTETTTVTGETTTMPETTTMIETTMAQCDLNPGVLCDEHDNLIEHIEHIPSASDCQAICQNHPECNYWSHYAEEGGKHWGHCLLHYNCDTTSDKECLPEGSHECPPVPQELYEVLFQYLPIEHGKDPRPGGKKCYCVSGAKTPDLDECDDGTGTDDPSTCADDFWPGWLCDEDENLIQHIEHISEPTDCQAICQNHNECEFFSHYVEEGGEHRGHCFLHFNCNKFDDHKCELLTRPGCPAANQLMESFFSQFKEDGSISMDPKSGEKRCHCFCGPKYPDMDDCSYPELY